MKLAIEESVLRQALEAFEYCKERLFAEWTMQKIDESVTALRSALDAAEGVEPVSIIEQLWAIIDDIDTYGDMAKSDDKAFRAMVERRQKDRWKTGITTDGYTLNIPNHPAPAIPEGWHLVPNVATDKMYFAFSDKYGTDFDQAYEAMLQAAPAVPEGK